MGKILVILLAIVVFSSSALALNISTELESDVFVLELGNTINMDLKVTEAGSGTYNLYTLSDILINPRGTFEVNEENFEKSFTLTPNLNLDVLGYYVFTVTLNHRGFEKVDDRVVVNIVSIEDAIEIGTEPVSLESDKIRFYVQNNEDASLKNLSANFSSILFDTSKTFDLRPFEKKFFEIDVDQDQIRTIKAGVYVLEANFDTLKGERRLVGNIYLGETKGIETFEDKSGLLIRSESITKINTGNVVESVRVSTSRNIFSRLFTTFNIEPNIVEREGFRVTYTWVKESFEPTQVFVVKARTNYLFPLLVIVLFVLAILGAKRFVQTKVEMKKSVSHVRTKNGEFALKIKVSIKARKDVENVSVVDKVPAIVKVYKKFGTIKPDKIDSSSRRIYWNLGELKAGEERVVTYIVYSRVGVVGKFSLPEAVGVFEKDGDIHEVRSNQVFFMSDQVRDVE